jgi:hypothetical protein
MIPMTIEPPNPPLSESTGCGASASSASRTTRPTSLTGRPADGHPAPRPYVGQGVDGCHRSAQIDREEADTLDVLDVRREQLYASADAWERQAEQLEHANGPRRPESERRGRAPHPGQPAPGRDR